MSHQSALAASSRGCASFHPAGSGSLYAGGIAAVGRVYFGCSEHADRNKTPATPSNRRKLRDGMRYFSFAASLASTGFTKVPSVMESEGFRMMVSSPDRPLTTSSDRP